MGAKNYDRQGCGSNSGYNNHIVSGTEPCTPCRNARARWQRGYQKRIIMNGGKKLMVDACGTRRRLQAMARLGWTYTEIGDRVGTKGNNLSAICTKKKQVYPETAQKVKDVYDELSMKKPPEDRAHKWARGLAKNKGFLPPLAWEDEMIDDPEALPMGVNQQAMALWLRLTATDAERERWKARQAEAQAG